MRSSAWIVPLQIGAFFGYFSFGFFADRVGRRPAFLTFVLMTAVLVPVYGLMGRNAALLLAMGPLVGFFGHGYFSALGAMAAELFPAAVRTTAQGFCYNVGRALAGVRSGDGGCAGGPARDWCGAGVYVDLFCGGRDVDAAAAGDAGEGIKLTAVGLGRR